MNARIAEAPCGRGLSEIGLITKVPVTIVAQRSPKIDTRPHLLSTHEVRYVSATMLPTSIHPCLLDDLSIFPERRSAEQSGPYLLQSRKFWRVARKHQGRCTARSKYRGYQSQMLRRQFSGSVWRSKEQKILNRVDEIGLSH